MCEDCTDQLAECETCYDNRDDYCNDQVLGPLRSQNMKQLKQLQEDHETRLGKLDTQIIELEENEKSLQKLVSSQNTEIATLRRWLHCETSTDPLGYKKADNTYEEDFKGKTVLGKSSRGMQIRDGKIHC